MRVYNDSHLTVTVTVLYAGFFFFFLFFLKKFLLIRFITSAEKLLKHCKQCIYEKESSMLR